MTVLITGVTGVGFTAFGSIQFPSFARVAVTVTGPMDFEVDEEGGRVGHLGYWCYAENFSGDPDFADGIYKGHIHWIDFLLSGEDDQYGKNAQGIDGFYHNLRTGVTMDLKVYD